MPTSWRPPEEFDEYRIVRPLGAGAMGQVFLAHDTLLDRPVAVKFLGSGDISNHARDRFLIEARALARLQHPNVVTVYRVGELGRRPYLISEFIHGESLDKIAKPMPWRRVCELAIGLARGLAAAHRRGVLHRDIKPANTILAADDAEVKLLDFGLAKLIDADGTRSSTGLGSRHPTPVPTPVPDVGALDATQDPGGTVKLDGETMAASAEPPAVRVRDEEPVSPSLTREGAVMGTPYYMPPEAWRGEPATTRSDVYSLGVLLYELAAGAPPHRTSPVIDLPRIVHDVAAPGLASVAPDVDPRFAEIVDRCLRREAATRYASADELREALEALTAPQLAAAAAPAGNPYRGLRAFEAEHRALFFGRAPEIRAVLDRLRTDPFVVVAGDSGVGKSSLIRAGVVPAVLDGALGGGRTWRAVTMVPGRRPAAALATELARGLELDEATLERDLVGGDPAAIATHRRAILRAVGGGRGLMIVIDQLEELVTIADPREARATAELLAELLSSAGRRVLLVATVRGDFLTRTASLPALGDEMPRALFLLRAMGEAGVREAIVGPARAKGVRFEPAAMVDELVAAAQNPGSLPLLQFALAELWEARPSGGDAITAAALDQIGGVDGALARHADQVIAGLLPAERDAARRILLALISADGTRARHTRAELVGADRTANAALEALVRGRLISVREGEGAPAYELAHETLLTKWDSLRGWLDDDGERRIVRRRVDAAAAEWQRLGRAKELLWGPRQLDEAARLDPTTVTPAGRELLEISARAATARRRRRIALMIGIPAAILAAIVIVRLRIDAADRQRRADDAAARDRRVAEHTRAADDLQAHLDLDGLTATRADAFARFDAKDLAGGEARWADALRLAGEADATQARIAEELEHALVIDPSRKDVRAHLAQVLFARAVLADDLHLADRRDELLRRLTFYDEDGSLRGAWNAPATLEITAEPAGATITIATITAQDGRRVEGTARPARATERLAPGSYVLACSAPGRANVRMPVELARGERVPIAVALPAADRVPEGFVYIPAGRFLLGSANEPVRRDFLTTVPVHAATTGAFLIAQHETTNAEWLVYLDTLPRTEQEQRRPQVDTFPGAVAIQRTGAGWELTLRPNSAEYRAGPGASIHYLDRTVRVEQDWSRMPVSGISLVDIEAYTRWLDRTGRVAHARPCTEHEWERAARGADDREYPHADRALPTDANFDETYGKQPRAMGPDEVGSYPASRSPFGLDDMLGNVGELTVGTISGEAAAMRGGSFYWGSLSGRSTNRFTVDPTSRSVLIGVRVCADP